MKSCNVRSSLRVRLYNRGGWREISHVGSVGSDARIGKTKIKKKHCIAAQRPPLLQKLYPGLYLQLTIVSVQSETVSFSGPYWSSDVMAFFL